MDLKVSVSNSRYVGVFLKSLKYCLHFPSCPPIVSVQERNAFSFSFGKRNIESGSLPAVLLADQAKTRFKFTSYFGCSVSRAVIHHNNLHLLRREILLQDAEDCSLYEAFMIIGIDQRGDEWLWHTPLDKSKSEFACEPRTALH